MCNHLDTVSNVLTVVRPCWRISSGRPQTELAAWRRRHSAHFVFERPGDLPRLAAPEDAGCVDRASRTAAQRSAGYLVRKRPYLDCPTALERGWPIATGIIEGACRYLVKDRRDITGACWGLDGAQVVLKLRTLVCNVAVAEYWRCHLDCERFRVHDVRYADGTIPKAA